MFVEVKTEMQKLVLVSFVVSARVQVILLAFQKMLQCLMGA